MVADTNAISLAVWDVPMPVVAGETFTIKAGAKSAGGEALAGARIEVCDATGKVVASGVLGDRPLDGTEALYWTPLNIPSPGQEQAAEYIVRLGSEATTRFSVAATAKPTHVLKVSVTEQDSKETLSGVEIRLGAFHARTGQDGRAEIRVCGGEYQLQLSRTAHIAQPTPIKIGGDVSIELTMLHVPEEHPDARWVR
jgi:hypothetical protein